MEVIGAPRSAQEWLSAAVGVPCWLVRQQLGSRRSALGPVARLAPRSADASPPAAPAGAAGSDTVGELGA